MNEPFALPRSASEGYVKMEPLDQLDLPSKPTPFYFLYMTNL